MNYVLNFIDNCFYNDDTSATIHLAKDILLSVVLDVNHQLDISFYYEDSNTLGSNGIVFYTPNPDPGPDRPSESLMQLNTKYVDLKAGMDASLSGSTVPYFTVVVLHEMMHGLGILYNNEYPIGWDEYINDHKYYIGPSGTPEDSSAVMAYRRMTGISDYVGIPVEDNFGLGSALSHWETGLKNVNDGIISQARFAYIPDTSILLQHVGIPHELMDYAFGGEDVYFSGLTVGALKDYGYDVCFDSPYIMDVPKPKFQNDGIPLVNFGVIDGFRRNYIHVFDYPYIPLITMSANSLYFQYNELNGKIIRHYQHYSNALTAGELDDSPYAPGSFVYLHSGPLTPEYYSNNNPDFGSYAIYDWIFRRDVSYSDIYSLAPPGYKYKGIYYDDVHDQIVRQHVSNNRNTYIKVRKRRIRS